MFAYIERDSFLHNRNPIIKLILVIILTVIVCLSYFMVLPAITFVIVFFSTLIWGKIPISKLLKSLMLFILISVLFMISMFLLRGLNYKDDSIVQYWIFRWTKKDIVETVSLGLRILVLVTISMSFVLTTNPRDLVLSLILQCKVPVIHGYATMATYRFLPELQEQVNSIHLAQEIRGIPWNRGFISRFSSPFRVILPLLCIAARRGERIACAMECRGLGRGERTYYKKTEITNMDKIFLFGVLVIYLMIIVILVKFDLYRLNFASIK